MINQEIKKKEKKLKTTTPGIEYKAQDDSLAKVQTKYKPVMTRSDFFKDSINKNILKLQAANADPAELEANVKKQEPSNNWVFDALDYLTRPGRGVVGILTSVLSQGNKQMENELGTNNPFEVMRQILAEGNLKSYEANSQEFTGANLLQALGGKTTSTEDWNNVVKTLGSLLVEIPLDPLNFVIGPAAKAAAKGVKGAYRGGKKALNIPSKVEKSMKLAVDDLAERGINLSDDFAMDYYMAKKGGPINTLKSVKKTVSNALGHNTAEMAEVNRSASINQALETAYFTQQARDAKKFKENLTTPFRNIVKKKNKVFGEEEIALMDDMKRVGIWDENLSVEDLRKSKKLQRQMFESYANHFEDPALVGEKLVVTPTEYMDRLLKSTPEDMAKSGGMGEGVEAAISGLPQVAGSASQLKAINSQIAKMGLLPKDPKTWDKFLFNKSVGTDDNPLFEIGSTQAFRDNLQKVKDIILDPSKKNTTAPKIVKAINQRQAVMNYVMMYFKRAGIQDLTKYPEFREIQKYLEPLAAGKKGGKLSKWRTLNDNVKGYAPMFAKQTDKIIKDMIKLHDNLMPTISKSLISKGKLSEKGKTKLKIEVAKLNKSKTFPSAKTPTEVKNFLKRYNTRTKSYSKRKQARDIKEWKKIKKNFSPFAPDAAVKIDNMIQQDFVIPKQVLSPYADPTARADESFESIFKRNIEDNIQKSLGDSKIDIGLEKLPINPIPEYRPIIKKNKDLFIPKKTKDVGTLKAVDGVEPVFKGYNLVLDNSINPKLIEKFTKNNPNLSFFTKNDNFTLFRNRALEQTNELAFSSFLKELKQRFTTLDPKATITSKWVAGNSSQDIVISSDNFIEGAYNLNDLASKGKKSITLRFSEPGSDSLAELKNIENLGISVPYYADPYTFKEELGQNFENIVDMVKEKMNDQKLEEGLKESDNVPLAQLETPVPTEPRPSIKEVVEKQYKPLEIKEQPLEQSKVATTPSEVIKAPKLNETSFITPGNKQVFNSTDIDKSIKDGLISSERGNPDGVFAFKEGTDQKVIDKFLKDNPQFEVKDMSFNKTYLWNPKFSDEMNKTVKSFAKDMEREMTKIDPNAKVSLFFKDKSLDYPSEIRVATNNLNHTYKSYTGTAEYKRIKIDLTGWGVDAGKINGTGTIKMLKKGDNSIGKIYDLPNALGRDFNKILDSILSETSSTSLSNLKIEPKMFNTPELNALAKKGKEGLGQANKIAADSFATKLKEIVSEIDPNVKVDVSVSEWGLPHITLTPGIPVSDSRLRLVGDTQLGKGRSLNSSTHTNKQIRREDWNLPIPLDSTKYRNQLGKTFKQVVEDVEILYEKSFPRTKFGQSLKQADEVIPTVAPTKSFITPENTKSFNPKNLDELVNNKSTRGISDYGVISFEKGTNQKVVDKFLKDNPQFTDYHRTKDVPNRFIDKNFQKNVTKVVNNFTDDLKSTLSDLDSNIKIKNIDERKIEIESDLFTAPFSKDRMKFDKSWQKETIVPTKDQKKFEIFLVDEGKDSFNEEFGRYYLHTPSNKTKEGAINLPELLGEQFDTIVDDIVKKMEPKTIRSNIPLKKNMFDTKKLKDLGKSGYKGTSQAAIESTNKFVDELTPFVKELDPNATITSPKEIDFILKEDKDSRFPGHIVIKTDLLDKPLDISLPRIADDKFPEKLDLKLPDSINPEKTGIQVNQSWFKEGPSKRNVPNYRQQLNTLFKKTIETLEEKMGKKFPVLTSKKAPIKQIDEVVPQVGKDKLAYDTLTERLGKDLDTKITSKFDDTGKTQSFTIGSGDNSIKVELNDTGKPSKGFDLAYKVNTEDFTGQLDNIYENVVKDSKELLAPREVSQRIPEGPALGTKEFLEQQKTGDKVYDLFQDIKRQANETSFDTQNKKRGLYNVDPRVDISASKQMEIEDIIKLIDKERPQFRIVNEVTSWLNKGIKGDAGLSRKKWNRLKKTASPYDEDIIKEMDKILKAEFRRVSNIAKKSKVRTTLRKGEITPEAAKELNDLMTKYGDSVLGAHAQAQRQWVRDADKLFPIGSTVQLSDNPVINKWYSQVKLQHKRGNDLLQHLDGVTKESAEKLIYKSSITGDILKDYRGNPVPSNYVPRVAAKYDVRNALNPKLSEAYKAVEAYESSFAKRVGGAKTQALESNYLGRTSDINKAVAVKKANLYLKEGVLDASTYATPELAFKASLNLAELFPLFVLNPMATAAKKLGTVTAIYGLMGPVRAAIQNNLIKPAQKLTTDDLATGNFIPLKKGSTFDVLAKTDEKLALKVAQGKPVSVKELNHLIQNKMQDFFEGTGIKEVENLYVDRHLDQLWKTAAPSQRETSLMLDFLDSSLGIIKKTMLLTTGFAFRVLTGDIIHGLVAGVPLGHMVNGWRKGQMDLYKIRKLNQRMDDIVREAATNSEDVVVKLKNGKETTISSKEIVDSADHIRTNKYIKSKLTPEELNTLKMKTLYEDKGIINSGEYTQDKDFGAVVSTQDYSNLATRIMISAGSQFTDPASAKAIKFALRKTNDTMNKFIGFGHTSSEASRIATYRYMTKKATRDVVKTKLGFVKHAPGEAEPLIRANWERLGYKNYQEGINFALYGNRRLSGFESKWMTRMLPFYRFWRFAIEQNVTSVYKGNLKPYYNIQRFFNNVKRSQNIDNEDLSDYTINQNYLPIRWGDDKISILKVGYTPSTLTNFISNPQTNAFNEILGQTNPLIKALLESATGTNSYTGMEYDNTWETWASNLIPQYTRFTSARRANKKYEDDPSKKRDLFTDSFPAIFKATWEGDAAFNRLYKSNQGLQDMISKIVKEGGYVPNINELLENYLAGVIKKKKYN